MPSIRIKNSAVILTGSGESIFLSCGKAGLLITSPCGGNKRCGKCKIKLLEGQVECTLTSGIISAENKPKGETWIAACSSVPVGDITIALGDYGELSDNEVNLSGFDKNLKTAGNCKNAGVALDIGTTTVSAMLVDLDNNSVLDTISQLNDQRSFGSDVMSRINASINGKTEELFNLINRQTQRILDTYKKKFDIPKIEKLSVSGNTVMLHLFLNVNPSGMGKMPFTPVFLKEKELKGKNLNLCAETVYVLPSIDAFIGSDITAGLAVLDILNTDSPSLLIDIGTNGEMALAYNGNILCCSTAAGPAFEGAEISCGVGGIRGAVSRVEGGVSKGSFSITTIGNAKPVGICGSGLVDAVSLMLNLGIIDETGFMADLQKSFSVAPGISITDRDIRQFQLAKSAIYSGIKVLCKRAGVEPAGIKNVYIAGGFGFFINKTNAITAGILPNEFANVISVCGNLSLQGAVQNITNKKFIQKCNKIKKSCSVIDLASDPSFADEFIENMNFPCI